MKTGIDDALEDAEQCLDQGVAVGDDNARILAALQQTVERMRESILDVLSDLEGGFVRCQRCGDQEDTATLDCVKILRDALSTALSEPKKKPCSTCAMPGIPHQPGCPFGPSSNTLDGGKGGV